MNTNYIETVSDDRWTSIVKKDRAADGEFFYSVETTGVYCRPSCAARLAKPENVRFHLTCEDAEKAGFRACKRCKPDRPPLVEQHTQMVTEACRFIEGAESVPSLEQLARRAGMSVYHFHRIFKAVTGLTPKDYATGHRSARMRAKLESSDTVTAAIYEAGYNSNGRFYEKSDEVLGMGPGNYRDGGAHTEIEFAVGECSLGSILVARTKRGLCAISLGDDPDALVRDLKDRFPKASIVAGDCDFKDLVSTVIGFVERPAIGLDLPLDLQGTAFQQRVWKALKQIPAGSTATYAEIADRIGMPKSVRAVAQACGANPVAVAVPCHRVVRSDGGVSGYRWGVGRKRDLLRRESDGSLF